MNEKKWVLITGASRGIGKEIAQFMAMKGFNLILHSRDLKHTEVLKETLEKENITVYCVSAELSNHEEVVDMLKTIDGFNLDVQYVFNNAGIQIAYRPDYYQTPIEDFEMSFKINTIAVATICYHFLPKMIKNSFGRIINTTSGISFEPEQAGYSASKAALDKFTIDIGSKLEGTNVMINLTDPGWCRTDLGGSQAPNDPKSTLPGVVLPAFLNDKKSGRIFSAQDYSNLSLEEAIRLVEGE